MRLPTYRQLQQFVEVEGWEDKDQVSGKRKGDHHRYVFTTPDGERLYTRIFHGRGQIANPDLFVHILRDQLRISEKQFWNAVDHGTRPVRPNPTAEVKLPSIDGKLARNLVKKVGLTHDELAQLTQGQAVTLWHEWLEQKSIDSPDRSDHD